MQFKIITKHKLPFFVALGLMTVLTSCGSFQYVGYDNDGIYSSEDYNTTDVEQPVATTSSNDSEYYKNYFADSSAQLEAVIEDNEIFTDIDSYEGNYLEKAQDTIEQRPVYGGWGQNNESITINIIDNGWYGWNDPWLWNVGWGYGWNNWGWGRPWRWNYGWNYGYGWNAGWGYGWNNWGWGPGWGNGWNNWGWNGYYRGYRYAYNAGRRGSVINNSYLNSANRSTSAISRRNYSSRSAVQSRASRSNSAVRTSRNGTIRSTSRPSSSRISRPNTSRSSGTVRSTRSSRSSSGTIRSTRSSRSSSGSVRSSRSSSSRSSGSIRSSGSSRSSSSGSRSGGSTSRRGRG